MPLADLLGPDTGALAAAIISFIIFICVRGTRGWSGLRELFLDGPVGGLGGTVSISPARLLEAAGAELEARHRVVDGEPPRLELELDGGRSGRIELAFADSAGRCDVKLEVAHAGTLPEALFEHPIRGPADAASWPAGIVPAREAEAREALRELLGAYGIEWVRIHQGRVIAYHQRWSADAARRWARALRLLEALARALEPPVPAVRLDVRETEDGHPLRCAYCHGDLAADEPAPFRCEACGTLLHAGCRQELGRCPALGCSGERPGRARAR